MRILNARKWCAVGLMLALSAAAAMAAKQPRRVDDEALRKAATNGEEWLSYGHDYTEQHYSPLKQMNASNVSRLGLAWYYQTDSQPGTEESAPIVANGVMYFTTSWNGLYAVDARTGVLKWSWIPDIPHQNFKPMNPNAPDRLRIGPSVCCGPANRGVAIYNDKIYMGTLDARLIAFDAETGKIVWQAQVAPEDQDYSVTGAPRIVKGMVVIGNAGGEYAVRGYVSAYNAETGKLVWRTYTVPGDPAKPFEDPFLERAAKTWTGSEWWKLGGGGTVWNAISYDPKLNLVYIGTSQGGPWVQEYRSPGGGANQWICSIIALNADTGKYVWAYQTTPGDNWDYDAVQDMILADLKIDGKKREVLMQAPKNGVFYVLDRKTGQFISCAPYTKVTWATSFDPKTGEPTINKEMIYDTSGTLVWPGPAGGHSWDAMSFNPDTGLAYIPEIETDFLFMKAPEFKPQVGVYNWGIILRPPTPPAGGATNAARAPRPGPPGGALEAWDPITQTQRWSVPQFNGSGTMTTAGNLVFAASQDGEFAAFSADTGKQLWKAKLLPEMGNPVTYSIDGKQYVSVLAGRAGKSRLYTFALDATQPLPEVGPQPQPGFGGPPPAPSQPHQGGNNGNQ
ncbi:MAG: PQQ-dependent dehydrogenase, methanol/ethanol family [Acidobacteriota bacterium]|nr:PQQ-dependent dehydrogenase, methanol/ethanol family [Acidobacteriota bacterium]MDE3170135.1 PQQ-dependent dehydrogenase, methanol/ethanol family [Acidobacteriota bacterium]